MNRHRPSPFQCLFRWVWHDPSDDRPDDPDPPLRARVRRRNEPTVRTLWGFPVVAREGM